MEKKLELKSNCVFWASGIAVFTAIYGAITAYVCKCEGDIGTIAIFCMVIGSLFVANIVHRRVFGYLYVIGIRWEKKGDL